MPHSEKIVIAPGWENFLGARGLNDVATIYRVTDGEAVTRSGTTEVRRIELSAGGTTRTVFIKKYWANSARQLWSGALRGTFFGISKARREYENLERLRALGLDAPAPVAYGEERRWGWLTRSFLISEGIAEALPLDVFIRDVLPGMERKEQKRLRRELIERLASYTSRLHAQRFVHHDYFWRNIILNGQSLAHFWLIDAHKGRVWGAGGEQTNRAKDLATLDSAAGKFFRRSERLKFFLRYMGHERLSDPDRALLRQVLRVAAPLREKQIGRVLGSGRKSRGQ